MTLPSDPTAYLDLLQQVGELFALGDSQSAVVAVMIHLHPELTSAEARSVVGQARRGLAAGAFAEEEGLRQPVPDDQIPIIRALPPGTYQAEVHVSWTDPLTGGARSQLLVGDWQNSPTEEDVLQTVAGYVGELAERYGVDPLRFAMVPRVITIYRGPTVR